MLLTQFLYFRPAQTQIVGKDITSIRTKSTSIFPTFINNIKGENKFAGRTLNLNFRGHIQSIMLFAPDVTRTPATLLNVANSCFPTNTEMEDWI